MGLIISKYAHNGVEFSDAYAKVGEITYSNSSKIANFSVEVFNSKAKMNSITKIQGLYVKCQPGADMIAQCYFRINEIIAQEKQYKSDLEKKIESETDINRRWMLVNQLSNQKSDIQQLDGALSDEIIISENG